MQRPLRDVRDVVVEERQDHDCCFGVVAALLREGRVQGAQYWSNSTAYPSQWRSWIALGPACVGPYLIRRSVTVQHVDPHRLHEPPHPGVPYFERRFGISAATVLSAVREL